MINLKTRATILVYLFFISIGSGQIAGKIENSGFSLAPSPPMGWNSYNSYGAAVTEKEVRANAEYMAKYLKQYGWEYVVVDYCWSYPHPPGSTQNNPPQFRLQKDGAYVPWLAMDEEGRLYPDPRKFPSSSNGAGFKPLADYVHSLGLKFGIHVMRGIPRQAVWAKSPIDGIDDIDASMVADTTSVCPWLNQMYGVDMEKPGAQEYYNSLAILYASWGVDFIKMDDMDLKEGYPYRSAEVEAMRKAIDHGDRPITLSLSLNMKYKNNDHMKSNAEMWRISKDFWDEWRLLENQFELCAKWAEVSGPDSWPDADMLQLGWISRRGPHGEERESRFTEDEQITHFTLWSIFRSPLMMGGDMPDNSDFVYRLLSNGEVIRVNQNSKNSRQLSRRDGLVIWVSEDLETNDLNVAFFNLNDAKQEIILAFKELGLKGKYKVRDLSMKKDLGEYRRQFSANINVHGAGLYRLSKVK